MDTCTCTAESLCCPSETVTTLLTGYNPIQNKKFFFFFFFKKKGYYKHNTKSMIIHRKINNKLKNMCTTCYQRLIYYTILKNPWENDDQPIRICKVNSHTTAWVPNKLVTRTLNFANWRRVCVLSHVWLFMTSWTVANQAPLSIEFSKQEYWSG